MCRDRRMRERCYSGHASQALLERKDKGITLGQIYACSAIPCTDYGIDGATMLKFPE